ncbi:MAG: tetratricopeptide repeat protein [Spirochaetaceae bacterium]|nr:tetratricopeptide repeat protein [Spirochaetaceae bacterium]
MDTGIIILLIIIAGGLLGVLVFFLIRSLSAPQKISSLQEQVKQGKVTMAIRGAKQILAKEPRNTEAHYLLGLAYAQDEKYELALMAYKTVNQIGDFSGICNESDFRKDIAALFLQFGQEEEALKEYLLLTKLEPYISRHYYNVGQLFETRNKGGQAVIYYKKALEINPRFSDSWFALGQLMYRAKRQAEAGDALQKALKLRPDNYKAYFYLGRILKDSRNFTGALGAFENAQKEPDFKIKALVERGSCFISIRKYEKAQNELERAIKISSEDSDSNELLHARYFLSICYERTRNLDKAIEQWELLYAQKKTFRDVAEKLSQYQELRGDDRIKDFITESPEKFEKTCQKLTAVMNLTITDYISLDDGCQITAVDRSDKQWRNIRRFPKFLRILRVPDTIDLHNVREFHEQMRKAGVNRGYYISSSNFTRSAYEFTESRPIDLIPREKLQEMLQQTEKLDKDVN